MKFIHRNISNKHKNFVSHLLIMSHFKFTECFSEKNLYLVIILPCIPILQILYILDTAQGYVVLAYLIIINLNLATYMSYMTIGACE